MKKQALALLLLTAPSLASATEKPNIVFILADDMGWSDLGCYGHPEIKTPNLDRLAAQGSLFTQFYVNAPVCSPSRAAFLTGRYPGRLAIHGHFASIAANTARAMPQYLDPTVPNVASVLHNHGYATAHTGKWHLRNNVSQLMDEEPVDERGQGPTPAAYGFDFVGSGEPWGAFGPKNDPYYRARSSALLVDETIAFIRQHRNQSFYAQLWALVPHARLNPMPEQMKPYAHLHPGDPEFPHTSAAEIYYSSITDLDAQIGRLLQTLDELDLTDKTLVIFSSDNGPEDIHIRNAGHSGIGSAGDFRGRKRSLYEGGIRVPLIVRWPGKVPAGRIDETSLVSAVDLLPTLSRLAGINLPSESALDGEDVSDAFFGHARARTKPLMWETRYSVTGDFIHQSPQLAIRERDWKLLLNPSGDRVELYNVGRHPEELDNVAGQHPEIVAGLRQKVIAWSQSLPPGPTEKNAGAARYPWPGKAKPVDDPAGP